MIFPHTLGLSLLTAFSSNRRETFTENSYSLATDDLLRLVPSASPLGNLEPEPQFAGRKCG